MVEEDVGEGWHLDVGTAGGWGLRLNGKSKRDAVVTVAGKSTRSETRHAQFNV